ncbi:hypothetical protein K2173_023082 [Erythroxylum novogranatense]|uniref:Flavin-containing monooxygenase n=1 Tax=Erythroxylum novogranatense TaxID=1862640 RepID=A0AAV8T9V7_9ROSI|nr:hypothetical protein K2173_023082 [Erythroxylum novogranatense]
MATRETMVIIVGAGPAGLATSACLNNLNVPNVLLEREDCFASLWRKRAYDRLKLHLAKQFCELPHMPYPPGTPTFVPKDGFISYLEKYVSKFEIKPKYNRCVESAFHDDVAGKWVVTARDRITDELEVYSAKFLVVATGENSDGFVPKVPGLECFDGKYIHSNKYDNGKIYEGKQVLVVGSGNSGMEIAYDLYNWGAITSVVVRSPVHVTTKEVVYLGMWLLRYLPVKFVDFITMAITKVMFGNLSKYGIIKPKEGPFYLKKTTRRSPIIDVGTLEKIKSGAVEVLPAVESIKGKKVRFRNGKSKEFDVIIFATGYRSTVLNWLKGGYDLFNEDGMPRHTFPNHWKGENGLYCAGFSSMGLDGIARDARNIASDVSWKVNGDVVSK